MLLLLLLLLFSVDGGGFVQFFPGLAIMPECLREGDEYFLKAAVRYTVDGLVKTLRYLWAECGFISL